MLLQLPIGNDGLPADLGVLHYHGIRRSKLALDAVVFGIVGVSSPPSPAVAPTRVEKTNFDKYLRALSGGGEDSPRHPVHSLCGSEIWCSRRLRHGFLTEMTKHSTTSI
jgi:hypothetical protein